MVDVAHAAATVRVVTATASASPKRPEKQQDRAAIFNTPSTTGVVVCDGVGQYGDSGDVATIATDAITHVFTTSDEETAHQTWGHAVEHAYSDGDASALAGATTVIALSSNAQGTVTYSFAGNGALLELSAASLTNERWRLCWVNHLLPHISYGQGRETLASCVGPNRATTQVSTGKISSQPIVPRLFLACTDGIYSEEEATIGTMSDGAMWREIPRPLAELLKSIEPLWGELQRGNESAAQTLLTDILASALTRSNERGEISDDATAGALLLLPIQQLP